MSREGSTPTILGYKNTTLDDTPTSASPKKRVCAPASEHAANKDSPRLLVIRRRYLGDIALLGSVFKNLRLHWPEAQIALLAEHAYAPVGALHADLNRVRSFPRKLTQWPRFIRELRRTRFTHVLDFDNSDKTALVSRLTAAPVRVTYEREDNPIRQRWTYTVTAKISAHDYHSQHITETYLALLTEIGIPIRSREICLTPSLADQARIQKFARPTSHSSSLFTAHPGNAFGQNFEDIGQLSAPPQNSLSDLGQRAQAQGNTLRVLVHPGSRSRFRLWPVERFAAVCDRLQDELDARVFLVAGPSERGIAHAIRDAARSHLVLIDEALSISEFAALCQHFDLMLCHDSGPMHIAAGVGTPVVALYSSQNATTWAPLGQAHRVLQTTLPCSCLVDTPTPCIKADSYRNYCVRKLSVEEVYDAIASLTRANRSVRNTAP